MARKRDTKNSLIYLNVNFGIFEDLSTYTFQSSHDFFSYWLIFTGDTFIFTSKVELFNQTLVHWRHSQVPKKLNNGRESQEIKYIPVTSLLFQIKVDCKLFLK
jgi:hypothetical protein